METKGWYSVVRFVPDAFRGEGVNLGVVLLCPERRFLGWRFARDHKRARSFFHDRVDAVRLRTLEDGLETRLQSERESLLLPDNLRQLASRHQDMLELTAPRSIAVAEPESELSRLFERLVGPLPAERSTARAMNALQVRHVATEEFARARILDRLQQDVELRGKYRPSPYQFAFGYQNGGPYKLIQTTSFALRDPDQSCERALVVLGEIQDLRDNLTDRKRTFEVIGAFSPEQAEARTAILAAFQDKQVKLWEPEQVAQLAQRVRRELH